MNEHTVVFLSLIGIIIGGMLYGQFLIIEDKKYSKKTKTKESDIRPPVKAIVNKIKNKPNRFCLIEIKNETEHYRELHRNSLIVGINHEITYLDQDTQQKFRFRITKECPKLSYKLPYELSKQYVSSLILYEPQAGFSEEERHLICQALKENYEMRRTKIENFKNSRSQRYFQWKEKQTQKERERLIELYPEG